jgi:uncharacterized membrane protein
MNAIENILEHLVQIIELISTAILLTGFGKAVFGFVKAEWRSLLRPKNPDGLSQLRLQLGTYILLGLDFYIVSDIIHSMIRPELNELINLALIVVLRTTIGFFLGKEIAEIEKSEHRPTR